MILLVGIKARVIILDQDTAPAGTLPSVGAGGWFYSDIQQSKERATRELLVQIEKEMKLKARGRGTDGERKKGNSRRGEIVQTERKRKKKLNARPQS